MVADLLLSGLCKEVGYELYEMDEAVRKELLQRFKAEPRFYDQDAEDNRILQLSRFILEYVEQQLNSDDIDGRDFAQAHQWIVLAHTQPKEIVKVIADTFRQLLASDVAYAPDTQEILRLTSLVETITDPLEEAELQSLLKYMQAMASFGQGDLESATTKFSTLAQEGKIQIAGEDLPIPAELQSRLESTPQAIRQNFSHKKLRGRSFKGQDLTGANFSHADLRGANFSRANLVGANFSYARMGLQRRWATQTIFSCFLLLIFLGVLASGLGALLGGSFYYGMPSEGREFNLTNIQKSVSGLANLFSQAGIVSLGILPVIGWVSRGKPWQMICLRGIGATLLFSPAAIVIGILLFRTFRVPSSTGDLVVVGAGLVAVLAFTLSCIWIVLKGVSRAWMGTSVALLGLALLVVSIISGIVGLLTVATEKSSAVSLLATAIAISLAFRFAYLYGNAKIQHSLNTESRINFWQRIFQWLKIPWITAVVVTIALAISYPIATFEVTISMALSAMGLVLALELIYESSDPGITQARTWQMGFAFIGVFIAIGLVMSWVIGSISLAEQSTFVFFVLGFGFVVTPFLTLAGFTHRGGAIAGIYFPIVAIAGFFILVWINITFNYFLNDWLLGIVFVLIIPIAIMVAIGLAEIIAFIIVLIWAESSSTTLSLIWTILIFATSMLLIVSSEILSRTPIIAIAETVAVALAILQLGIYIAIQAIEGNSKFVSVRQLAIAWIASGGTNFWQSNLTQANFAQARLKAANLQQAILSHSKWLGAKDLNRACGNDSYLQYPQVQQVLVSGNGQNQNFDRLNLQGIHWRNANLANARFVNTDFSHADLQGANLSGAKLVNSNLEGANLAGARLTGAYLQNCNVTPTTILEGIECDYIYIELSSEEVTRQPANPNQIFKPGQLARFLRNRDCVFIKQNSGVSRQNSE